MENIKFITYESALTNLCERNSSFDSGVLRIAYPGRNRNKTSISKEVFERCIGSLRNCPVVCNYDRESDTLGGHDMEVVRDADGNIKVCNLTTPVGVIPESARVWWDNVTEEDGTVREYLYAEVLLWKRQEAYDKLKRDGVTAHSMEIKVKDGEMIDGYYVIYDFEFTAFALIGVTPCFESSAIEVFSLRGFKEQMEEMMKELKLSNGLVYASAPSGAEDNDRKKTEGGEDELDEVILNHVDVEPEAEPAVSENGEAQTEFTLTGDIVEALMRSLDVEKICCEWGEYPKYCYVDCDIDIGEVYAWDRADWLLYGFKYEMNGDNAVIDFESKTRKKYVIADFDEGDQANPFPEVFEMMNKAIAENSEWESKYADSQSELATAMEKIGVLEQYKQDNEILKLKEEIAGVFAKFKDLEGIEAFEEMKAAATVSADDGSLSVSVEDLEEKCFALRGRYSTKPAQAEEKVPKLIVDREKPKTGRYGDLFERYGK